MNASTWERVQQDLTAAMKARDVGRVGVLRLLVAALRNVRIEKGEDLAEDDCVTVLRREAKKRRETMALYAADHPERAAAEQAELDIITTYLPEQLSEDAMRAVVKKYVEASGATTQADFGKVMPLVMGELKGKADGKLVRDLLTEALRSKDA